MTAAHEHEADEYRGEADAEVVPWEPDTEAGAIPWHLKAVLAALALYLGWRAWEAIVWTVGQL